MPNRYLDLLNSLPTVGDLPEPEGKRNRYLSLLDSLPQVDEFIPEAPTPAPDFSAIEGLGRELPRPRISYAEAAAAEQAPGTKAYELPETGFAAGFRSGLRQIGGGAETTGELVRGQEPLPSADQGSPAYRQVMDPERPLAERLLDPTWWSTFAGEMAAGSTPFLAGAAAGGTVGGPVGAALGGGLAVAWQTLGSEYQTQRLGNKRQAPKSHEEAVSIALPAALASAGINAASIPMALRKELTGSVGRVLASIVAQSGLGGVDTAVQNIIAGRPLEQGVPESMLGEAIFEAPVTIGVVRQIARDRRRPAPSVVEPALAPEAASQSWEPAAGGSLMEQAYGDPAEAIRFLRAEAGVRGFTEAQVDRLVQGATTPAGYERILARVMARPAHEEIQIDDSLKKMREERLAREAAGIGRRTATPPAPPSAATPPESLVPGPGAPASVSPPEAVTTAPAGQPDLPTPAEMAALEGSLSRSTIPAGQQQKLLAAASQSRKVYETAVTAARQRRKPEEPKPVVEEQKVEEKPPEILKPSVAPLVLEAAVAPPKAEEPTAPTPAPERSDRVQTWQKAVADAEQPATLDDALRSIATDTGLSSNEKASLVKMASLKRQELVGRQQPEAIAPPAGPPESAPPPKSAPAEVRPAEQPAAVAMEQPEPEEAPVAAPPPPVVHGFRDDQQLKRYVLEMGSPRDLDPETLARLRGAGFKYNPRRQWWAAQPSEVAKALGEELAGQKITFSNEKSARLPRTSEGAHRLSLAQITRGQLDPREVGRIVGMMGEPDDPRVKNKGYFKRFTGGRVSMEDFIAEGLADAEVGAVLRAHDIRGPEDVEKLAKALSNPEVARRQVSVSAQALEQDARAAEDVLGQQEQDWLKQTLVETKTLKERLAGISDAAALEVFSNEYVDALGRASSIGWGPKKIEVQTMAVTEAVRSRSRELAAAKAAPLPAAEPAPESGPTPATPISEPTPEPPAEKAAALIAAYRDGSRQLTGEDVAALDTDLLPAFLGVARGLRDDVVEGIATIKADQSRPPAQQQAYLQVAEGLLKKYNDQIRAAENRLTPAGVEAPEPAAAIIEPPAETVQLRSSTPAPAGPAFSLEQESAAEPPKRPVLADQPLGLELPRRQLPATALKGGGQGLEGVELAAAGEAEAAAEAGRAQEALSFEPQENETPEDAAARQQAEADMRKAGQGPEAGLPGVREQGQKSGEYGVAARGAGYEQSGPVFYSAVLRATEGLSQAKGTSAQMLAMLKKTPGVKQDELNWLGLEPWLAEQQGPVTREQLADFVRQNQVQVEEVVKGEKASYGEVENRQRRLNELMRMGEENGWPEGVQREYNALLEEHVVRPAEDVASVKFPNLVLPGGKNYREVFVTVPRGVRGPQITELPDRLHVVSGDDGYYYVEDKDSPGFGPMHAGRTEKAAIDYYLDDVNKEKDWKDGHTAYADIDNPIVRIRFDERTDSEGRRVLFIEEVQEPQKNQLEKAPTWVAKYGNEIGMKRMLRWAAENGFDVVAWTTGEQQAERYDLRKQIDHIEYAKREGDNYYAIAYKDGHALQETEVDDRPIEWIEEMYGKDVAQRVLDGDGEPTADGIILTGDNLKVGGEGLKAFYDRMLPAFVNKYAKKWGVKVGTTVLPYQGPLQDTDATVHAVPITDAMRQSVLGGQALMERGRSYAASDRLLDLLRREGYPVPETTEGGSDVGTGSAARPVGGRSGLSGQGGTGEHGTGDGTTAIPTAPTAGVPADGPAEPRAAGRPAIHTASGTVELSRPTRGAEPVPLGTALQTDRRTTGYVDLRGKSLADHHDTALAAQVFRDPKEEKIVFLAVGGKTNRVLGYRSFTSRHPATVTDPLYAGLTEEQLAARFEDGGPVEQQIIRNRQGLAEWVNRLSRRYGEPVELSPLHNHPTGRSLASRDDELFHRRMIESLSTLKIRDHVIINSGEYTVIDRNGNSATYDLSTGKQLLGLTTTREGTEKRVKQNRAADPLFQQLQERAGNFYLVPVRNSGAVAEIGMQLKTPANYVSLIYADSNNDMLGHELVHVNFFKSKEFSNFLRNRMPDWGATNIFAYYDGPARTGEEVLARAQELIRHKRLTDAVLPSGPWPASVRSQGVGLAVNPPIEPVRRTAESGTPYDPESFDPDDPAQWDAVLREVLFPEAPAGPPPPPAGGPAAVAGAEEPEGEPGPGAVPEQPAAEAGGRPGQSERRQGAVRRLAEQVTNWLWPDVQVDAQAHPELAEALQMHKDARETEKNMRGVLLRATDPDGFAEKMFQALDSKKVAAGKKLWDDRIAQEVMEQRMVKLLGVEIPTTESPYQALMLHDQNRGLAEVWLDSWQYLIKRGLLGKNVDPKQGDVTRFANLSREDVQLLETYLYAKSVIRRESVLIPRREKELGRPLTQEEIDDLNPDGKNAAWARQVLAGMEQEVGVGAEDLVYQDGRVWRVQGSADPNAEFVSEAEAVGHARSMKWKRIEFTSRQVGKFWRQALRYIRDNGLVSQEGYEQLVKDQMIHGAYLGPFDVLEHVAENIGSPERLPKTLSVSNQDVVKMMEGTRKQVRSLLDATPGKIYRMTALVERNRIMEKMYNLRRLHPEMKSVIVNLKGDARPPKGYAAVYFYQNGERKAFAVPQPIADMVSGMDRRQADFMMQMFSKFAAALRAGATALSPTFAIRNIPRDWETQLVAAESPLGPKDMKLAFDTFATALWKDETIQQRRLMREMKKFGGMYTGFSEQATPAQRMGGLLRGYWGTLRDNPLSAPVSLATEGLNRTLGSLSAASEQMTRRSLFLKTRATLMEKRGETVPSRATSMEAALQAINGTINFRKGGTVFRWMTMAVPFTMSRVGYTRTVVEGAMANRLRAGLLAAGAMSVAMMLRIYAWELYGDLLKDIDPSEEKDSWIFPNPSGEPVKDFRGDEHMERIKIPRGGFFAMAATPVEDFVDYIYTQRSDLIGTLLETAGAISPFELSVGGKLNLKRAVASVLPAPVRAYFETSTPRGYDYYKQRQLMTEEESSRLPALQYNPYTSRGARAIGTATAAIFGEENALSPIKIDHVARSLFGEFGMTALQSPEWVMGEPAERRALNRKEYIGSLPVIRGFYSVRGGQKKSAMFEAMDKAATETASGRFLMRQEVNKLLEEWPKLPADQRGKRLAETLPSLPERRIFLDALKRERAGFGKNETVFNRLKTFGVDSGERALAIQYLFNGPLRTAQDRTAFMQEAIRTKPPLVNPRVRYQILKMMEQGLIEPASGSEPVPVEPPARERAKKLQPSIFDY